MTTKGHPSKSQPAARYGSVRYLLALVVAVAYSLALLWPVVPARAGVSAHVVDGVLLAILSGGETLEIACMTGMVDVNDLSPNSGPATCNSITGINIQGSSEMDIIDLRDLFAADFPALVDVEVDASAGNDQIYASGFKDVLDGGPGDDTYIGTDKEDVVDVSQGRDYFVELTLPLGDGETFHGKDPAAAAMAPNAPGLETSIEAIDFNADRILTGAYQVPPDPIGGAGPAHVLSVVNSSVQWFTKGGVLQNSQRLGNNGSHLGSFFEPLVPVNRLFDPKAIYDQYAGRFLVVALERQDDELGDPVDSSRILLAVSDDSDPNGTWYYHAINSNITISGNPTWADYPGFAIDEEAVYVTNNMFTFSGPPCSRCYAGARLWIVNKAPFYSGGAASVSVYDPSGSVSPPVAATTMQPAHIFGTAPTSVGTWLVRYSGYTGAGQEFLSIIRVDDPLGTPSFAHNFVNMGNVDDTSVNPIPDAPQDVITNTVETNDRRALHAVWRDDSLWATFQVVPGSGADAGQTTAHWAQVDTSTLAAPFVVDSGNAGGEDIAAGTYTFFPSIAVDQCGNMGLGFAASAPSIFPGAYYSARYASDPSGTMQSSKVLAAGVDHYYRAFGGSRNRWGDYSGIALDPASEAAFWVYNEYALTRGTVLSSYPGEDGRWGTRWGSYASGIDYGDLPTSYTQTLNIDDGARHCLSSLMLGAAVDPDRDGQESATAEGDNDDGVTPTGNWSDSSGDIMVQVSGGRACMNAWLDYWDGTSFGADGDFSDAGEQIINGRALSSGTTPLSFPLPPGAASGSPSPTFFGRFRLVSDQDNDGDCTDQAAVALTGLESGGEVEDYRFIFGPTVVQVDAFKARQVPGSVRDMVTVGVWLGLGCLLAGYALIRLVERREHSQKES